MFCPFNGECEAFLTGRQHSLPVKSKKAPVRERYFHYLVFRLGPDKVGMRRRTEKDIWTGLYDFYLVEAEGPLDAEEVLLQEDLRPWLAGLVIRKNPVRLTHLLTHQKVYARLWQVEVRDPVTAEALAGDGKIQFFDPAQIDALPKPIMIDTYLKNHLF